VRSLERAGAGGVVARFGDGSTSRHEGVVLAVPAPATAAILGGELPAAADALLAIPHGTSILVTLAYDRAAVHHELVGHGYLVPPTLGGAISACTWTSRKWPGRAPDDAVLLRLFVRDEGAWTSLPDDDLVAAARADAERTLSISGAPRLVRVARWAGSMPRYTVGHLGRVAAIDEAMAAWPEVVLAGASYRGVGLPDCISGGLAAAATIRGLLGGSTAGRGEAVA
jgi:oxygen-dependent protoporphyrinogen oxidase